MTFFEGYYNTWAGALILIAVCLLPLGQFAVLLRNYRDRRGIRMLFFAGAHFLAGFFLLLLFLDGVFYPSIIPGPRVFPGWERALLSFPMGVYVMFMMLFAGILFLTFRDNLEYRRKHLTPNAIRQTLDALPVGIAISDPDGVVRLVNLKMDSLCSLLTGTILSDAARFWKMIETRGIERNGQFLIKTPEEEAWLFIRERIDVKGKEFIRITASDVTARYRIIEELQEKNDHLQDIRRRMKAVSEFTRDMFVAEEEANARVSLHNQLGQVLLMGRHYLTHPESTDAEMVALMTREMNRFLLREAEEAGEEMPGGEASGQESPAERAVRRAGRIGVKVEMKSRGEGMPVGLPARILAAAIEECAANTAKHAEGDTLLVSLTTRPGEIRITVRNNGKPPKGPIAESGGLLSLRRMVEAAGGEMTVESSPEFRLILQIPEVGLPDST